MGRSMGKSTRQAGDARERRARPAGERATAPRAGKRLSLAELLAGSERLPEIHASVSGALDGPAVGREIG